MSKFDVNSTGFLGFANVQDFLESFLGTSKWAYNGILAVIGAVTTFITGYMWNDPKAVWTLWILMAADWATGILKGILNKKFVSYKLWRMPLYYVATSFVIAISWWMSKSSNIFYILPSIVIAGFYSVYFTSMLENLGEVGLLPKGLTTLLKNRFGLKKLFKEEDKTEQ